MQAVTLTLECIPSSCSVLLFFDSVATINACVFELSSGIPDFNNWYWVKHRHVFNLIRDKDLSVSWAKVKSHAGVPSNVKADRFADETAGSFYVLLVRVRESFLMAKNTVVSDNACYFVRNFFRSICHARWKASPNHNVVSVDMLWDFDWVASVRIWHPDSHMLTGFTSQKLADLHTYLIKTLHRRLPVAVRKKLYDRYYPGV
ncbi:hypothetical protein G9A89_000072 [Geosiphon pyriformis]|nr:hypothetical protein G9A89_000072 [Geosiphon pyriformis]